jgi:diguanylate cyclase (GGDEF)-like protein
MVTMQATLHELKKKVAAMSLNMSKQAKRHVKPVLPPDEAKRLATLYFLELLDSAPQEQFDRIARMAQRLFTAPIAVISFIDADREWFKSSIGVDVNELPREFAFASYTILARETFIVEDAAVDLRFFDNPLVRGASGIQFYAGCPIKAWNGVNIGALSIMDTKPRTMTEYERTALRDLTAAIEHEIGAGELKLVDELTGLMNQRGLSVIANHIVPRVSRDGQAMSMLFIDVEELSALNHQYGHHAGDAILTMIADVLRETLRGADIPARMRADDFAILLPDTEENEVHVILARIEREIARRMENRALPRGFRIRTSRATIDPSSENFSLEGLIALGAS